jgi:uncharacterized membrane protein
VRPARTASSAGSTWNDQRIEELISYLLIAGVSLSALLVLIGGVIYLARHGGETPDYRTFRGEPAAFRSIHGLISLESLRNGLGLIQLGLVLLILTPIARVAFAMAGFARERDGLYVLISAIVLALLLYSFTSGA